MTSIRQIAASILALSLTACAPVAPAVPQPLQRTGPASVLLISLDAFRVDYLQRGLTPNLARIAREGVRAEWMTPSYPSLTFPNHYTIVTGLRPDRHGIVHNNMRDASLGPFSLSNREAIGTAAWWGGEPVWITAEKAGLPTAPFFWPGSEAALQGVRPTRWQPYDEAIPVTARVDTVLGWLSEPETTRPRFATLYVETLDDAGHRTGPDSVEMRDALREVDAAIGRLIDGLAARALLDEVNLIITSDHGLAPVAQGNTVAIEEMVDPKDAAVVSTGQSVGFNPVAGREKEAYAKLLGKHSQYRLLAQKRPSRAVALRPSRARAGDRVPDARGLGRRDACRAGEAAPGGSRIAWVRSRADVDAHHLHRARALASRRPGRATH